MMRKMVVVCFYQAYPPASGAASVTFHLAKYMQGRKWLIQMADKDDRKTVDDAMTIVSMKYDCRSRLRKLGGLWSRIHRIADEICGIAPDCIIFEGASWVLYFVLLHRELIKRGLTARIIYHSHNVEYLLRKEKCGRFIAGLTRWAEKYLLTHCDIATAVSDIDASQFESLYGVRPQILPNGVDIDRFDAVDEAAVNRIREKYGLCDGTVLFMGLIGYKPNDEAVAFLTQEVFPLLHHNCPQAKLVIIGGDVNVRLPWLLNPGCIPSDDIPAFVKACDVCVAPIFSGSGTRLKILEYLAAGKPVVATPKGAEGLALSDMHGICYAYSCDDFAKEVARLLGDAKSIREMNRKGREVVRTRYSWPVIVADFECYMRSCTGV